MDKSNDVTFNDVMTGIFNDSQYNIDKITVVFNIYYVKKVNGLTGLSYKQQCGDKYDPICILYDNKVIWQNDEIFRDAPLDSRFKSKDEFSFIMKTYTGQEIIDNLFTDGG